jgi:predicted RNA binding protein YcfA (HicA-like mRNA interferase family)
MAHDRKMPTITARRMVGLLRRQGFVCTRQKGSHMFFAHEDGRTTTLPYHTGTIIGRGLLKKILSQIEISPQEFFDLL